MIVLYKKQKVYLFSHMEVLRKCIKVNQFLLLPPILSTAVKVHMDYSIQHSSDLVK